MNFEIQIEVKTSIMRHEYVMPLFNITSEVVRNNASIDWTVKESVRTRLKFMVKRALRKFVFYQTLRSLLQRPFFNKLNY